MPLRAASNYHRRMSRHKELLARYFEPEQFLRCFDSRAGGGVLFVETHRSLELNEQVTVIAEFPMEGYSFRLQGRVAARRRGSQLPLLPAGVEVVLAPDQRPTLEKIFAHIEGKQIDFAKRSALRLPVAIEIAYKHEKGWVREFVEDIGTGGVFVKTDRPLQKGSVIDCKLKLPGSFRALKLPARVAWQSTDRIPRGMGLEFIFDKESQQRRLAAFISEIRRRQREAIERSTSKIGR